MKLETEKIRMFDSINGTFDEYQKERYVFDEFELKNLLIDTFQAGVTRALNINDDSLVIKHYMNKLFNQG